MHVAFPSRMNGQVVVAMEKAAIADKHGLSANFLRLSMRSSDDQSLGAGAVDAAVTSLMPAVTYAAMAPGDVKIVAIVSRAGGKIVVLT